MTPNLTPTIDELNATLQKLEEAYKETKELADQRATLGYALQAKNVAFSLGTAPRHELEAAKDQLDKSVEATIRLKDIEDAIASQRKMVDYAKSAARRATCDQIAATYQATYEQHVLDCKATLASFRELQRLSQQHAAMSPRMGGEIMPPYYRELNLPALTGSLASRSTFTTGQE